MYVPTHSYYCSLHGIMKATRERYWGALFSQECKLIWLPLKYGMDDGMHDGMHDGMDDGMDDEMDDGRMME